MDFWKRFEKALRKEVYLDCFEKALKILFGVDNPEIWIYKPAPELADLITDVWQIHPELNSIDAVADEEDVRDLQKIAKKIFVESNSATNQPSKSDQPNNPQKESQAENSSPGNTPQEKQSKLDDLPDAVGNHFWKKLKVESQKENLPAEFIEVLCELHSKLPPHEFVATIENLSTDENDSLKQMIISRQTEKRLRICGRFRDVPNFITFELGNSINYKEFSYHSHCNPGKQVDLNKYLSLCKLRSRNDRRRKAVSFRQD